MYHCSMVMSIMCKKNRGVYSGKMITPLIMNLGVGEMGLKTRFHLRASALNKSSLKLELEVWSVLVFWTGASQSQLLSIQSTDPGALNNLNFF